MLVQHVAKPRIVQFALFVDPAFIPEILWQEPITARVLYAFITVHAAFNGDDVIDVAIGPSGAEWFSQTFMGPDITEPGRYEVEKTPNYTGLYNGEEWRIGAVYVPGVAGAVISSVIVGFKIIPIGALEG